MIVVVSEGRDRPGPVSPSKRTRWLWVANRDGKPALAPGVRTHQLSLLFGMGLDWYKRAMAEPEPALLSDVTAMGTGAVMCPTALGGSSGASWDDDQEPKNVTYFGQSNGHLGVLL